MGEAQAGQEGEQVVLGDPQLEMLALVTFAPLRGRGHLLGAEDVLVLLAVEHLPAGDPAAEAGRDRDVGRGGDDPLRQRQLAARKLAHDPPERLLGRRHRSLPPGRQAGRDRHGLSLEALLAAAEGHGGQERVEVVPAHIEPGIARPLLARGDTIRLPEALHLLLRHQPGMVVLVAGERQVDSPRPCRP